MTDREMLELAAKAARLPECGWMGPAFMYVKDNTFTDWNPLIDDGDALRLAVKLNMGVSIHNNHCMACAPSGMAHAVQDMPKEQAIRLAITRAAADRKAYGRRRCLNVYGTKGRLLSRGGGTRRRWKT